MVVEVPWLVGENVEEEQAKDLSVGVVFDALGSVVCLKLGVQTRLMLFIMKAGCLAG